MRHRKAGFKLGRTSSHRLAMLRNMAASLFEHGQIVTTVPKAKALQPFIEKIVTKAKHGLADPNGSLHARRQVISMLGRDRNAFVWQYLAKDAQDADRERHEQMRDDASQFFNIPDASEIERNRYGEVRKAPKLVKHIFDNVATRYAERDGGYTRIVRIGYHRLGDNAETCVIQFVGAEDGPEVGGQPGHRRRKADRRQKRFDALGEKVANPAAVLAAAAAPAAEAPVEPEGGSDAAATDDTES
ncbi:MAG: 50S ribosomal protein L17 [Planctomycetota bacterium]